MPNRKASKPFNSDLTESRSQPVQGNREIVVTAETHYQGPLPDPEMLVQYKSADPSFPERIMKMAEAHNAADVVTKRRISFSNLAVPIIGQVFTLILGAGGILACIYLAKAGYTGAAIAAIAGSFSPIIIGAFKSLQNRD